MKLSHVAPVRSAVFDDPNLVSCAGLVPVVGLAQRAGLGALVDRHVGVGGGAGHGGGAKVTALVAGMVAGADSIDDMDLLRHGGMGRLFTGVRAPSTLGTFLRAFTFGHVRQLDAVASRFLIALAGQGPLLPGADQVTYVDVDDTVKATFGYAKQGAGYGYSGVKGLNALIATILTPLAAPVIAATRLRKGSANSARGVARLVTDALCTARAAGATGMVILRADSAYYGHDVIAAARRRGAYFSVTARKDRAVTAAISSIDEQAWTTIRYPKAVFDEPSGCWISDAQVAEIAFTAFKSRRTSEHVTGRLIVRRVREANPDLKGGPLAHLPCGNFAANSAWLVLTAIAFNLTRAAGALASGFHAKATTATIRAQLISVPGRIARSARQAVLHLPTAWPWESAWHQLFNTGTGPPLAA